MPCPKKHSPPRPETCHLCKLYTTREDYRRLWDGLPPKTSAPVEGKVERAPVKGLGDKVEQALTAVGITSERVSAWLGKPCNCKERREKLNQLGTWASRVLSGAKDKAAEYLDKIVGG